MDPRIGAKNQLALSISNGIIQAPQTCKLPSVQENVADSASNNTGTNRTPRRVGKTEVDRTTPVPSGIGGSSTPAPSGISGTSSDPPSVGFWIPRIGNIQKLTCPNFKKCVELNAAVDRNVSNDPIAPLVSTQVFGDESSNSSSRDIYTR